MWALWIGITTPFVVIGIYIAVFWNLVSLKAVLDDGEDVHPLLFGPIAPPPVPVAYILINMCLWTSLVSQLALILLVAECTTWLKP